MSKADQASIDLVFSNARSQNGWTDQPVTDDELRAVYEIAKWGPTSMNTQPARFLFLRTPEAKARLLPCMSPGNQNKTSTAPVVAIIGHNMEFYTELVKNFAHNPNARAVFEGKEAMIQGTAFRNGTLQGAYLMVAARMQGLDCGPMSGFDAAKVDAEFWAGTPVKTNFIVGIGHGDAAKVMGRLPRYAFDEACKLL
jgi:3-hydroxypropanoate dehydrogenase